LSRQPVTTAPPLRSLAHTTRPPPPPTPFPYTTLFRSAFELNVMLPLLARNLLESIRLLATVSRVFADRCIDGIAANVERCREYRSEEHTSELQSLTNLVCRLLLENTTTSPPPPHLPSP